MIETDVSEVVRGKHGRQVRQRALLEAANQVFAEKGYDCATTREVAERANCSEGLIHRYFGGKHGLLVAILEQKGTDLTGTLAESMPEQPTLELEIEQMMLSALETYWQQRDFMRVCVSQSAVDVEIGRVIGERLNGARLAFIAERLRRHQAAGRIRDDVGVDAMALSITGLNISLGFFAQVAFGMDRKLLRDRARESARVIVDGLKPQTKER